MLMEWHAKSDGVISSPVHQFVALLRHYNNVLLETLPSRYLTRERTIAVNLMSTKVGDSKTGVGC